MGLSFAMHKGAHIEGDNKSMHINDFSVEYGLATSARGLTQAEESVQFFHRHDKSLENSHDTLLQRAKERGWENHFRAKENVLKNRRYTVEMHNRTDMINNDANNAFGTDWGITYKPAA